MRLRSPAAPVLLAGLLVGLLSGLLAGCGSDDSTAADSVSCRYPDDGRGAAKEVDPPPTTPAYTGQVEVTITTSAGEVGATLDADAAPCTVGSFLSLAEQGYFDDTPCHRLTTPPASISVLQCGDPTGTGGGGPGYSFADELTGSETYGAGTLAMANAGADTNGSQFFMVYADSSLDPDYTVFGHLDEAAVRLVAGIGARGTAGGGPDGAPAQPVTITGVTVEPGQKG